MVMATEKEFKVGGTGVAVGGIGVVVGGNSVAVSRIRGVTSTVAESATHEAKNTAKITHRDANNFPISPSNYIPLG